MKPIIRGLADELEELSDALDRTERRFLRLKEQLATVTTERDTARAMHSALLASYRRLAEAGDATEIAGLALLATIQQHHPEDFERFCQMRTAWKDLQAALLLAKERSAETRRLEQAQGEEEKKK